MDPRQLSGVFIILGLYSQLVVSGYRNPSKGGFFLCLNFGQSKKNTAKLVCI